MPPRFQVDVVLRDGAANGRFICFLGPGFVESLSTPADDKLVARLYEERTAMSEPGGLDEPPKSPNAAGRSEW